MHLSLKVPSLHYRRFFLVILFLSAELVSAGSQDTYEKVRPSVLQVLILDNASGTKSSFGSGFLQEMVISLPIFMLSLTWYFILSAIGRNIEMRMMNVAT